MYLKLAILLFVFTFKNVKSQQFSQKKECVEQGALVETNLRDLLFVTERFKGFNTQEDLDIYCTEAKKLIEESKKFKQKKCLTKLAAQVFNTIIPRFKSFVALRCSKEKDLTFKLAKCTAEKNKGPIRKCFLDYSNIIKYIANKVEDPTKMLSLLCCNYHRILRCLSSKEFKECEDVKRSSKFALDTVDGFLKELFTLLCSKFTPSSCASDGLMQELDNVKSNNGNINEFIIIPALRIADKLGD